MSRVPSQKTPFKISDIVSRKTYDEKTGKRTFRAYGTDYSEKSGHVFYIGSAPLERFIAFKAFFENIKINLDKDIQIDNLSTRSFQIIKEKSGKMSIDVDIVLPAHSTNEARNNLAKIEELQRLIFPGKWSAEGSTWKKNSSGKKVKTLDFSFGGVSSNTRLTTPLFHAFYKNIINSGFPSKLPKTITSYKQLIKHGFPCYIDTVVYEPDVGAGYFEFNDYLFPKIIKLKLKLNYETETLFNETTDLMRNKVIKPFQLDGHFSNYDSSLFPFGIKVTFDESKATNPVYEPAAGLKGKKDFTIKQMNQMSGLSSFIYISLPIQPWAYPHRYVMFKPFIENFSRSVKTKIQLAHTANSTIHSRVLQHGVTPDLTEYSFKVSIPSEDLTEAKKNCGKIQYLMRMFYKKYSKKNF